MDCIVDGDLPPLINPGSYEMTMVGYKTAVYYGRAQKLVISFRIVECGAAFESVLERYYNVLKLSGKPGKNGVFKVGQRSDFLREFCSVFPAVNVRRLDRIPMSYFDGVIVRGEVSTVTHDTKQHQIPKSLQYSKVTRLLEVVK